jgi:hypothetical protein
VLAKLVGRFAMLLLNATKLLGSGLPLEATQRQSTGFRGCQLGLNHGTDGFSANGFIVRVGNHGRHPQGRSTAGLQVWKSTALAANSIPHEREADWHCVGF